MTDRATTPTPTPAATPDIEAAWHAGDLCPLSAIPALCGTRCPAFPDVIAKEGGQRAAYRDRAYVTDGRILLAATAIRNKAARQWAASLDDGSPALASILPSVLDAPRVKTKAVAIQRLTQTLPPAPQVVHVEGEPDSCSYSLPRYRWLCRSVKGVASLALVQSRLRMLAFCDASGVPLAFLMPTMTKGGHRARGGAS